MVLILDRAPDGFGGIDPAELLAEREILADFSDAAGRHLVVADAAGRHRLLVKAPYSRVGHAFVIVPDQWRDARAAALSAYLGPYVSARRPASWPSRFQRHRLTVLLAILDRLERADGEPVTIRDLADSTVYPRVELGRAIEWKSSSCRRQTQRLLNEALAMAGGGYRRLLRGRL